MHGLIRPLGVKLRWSIERRRKSASTCQQRDPLDHLAGAKQGIALATSRLFTNHQGVGGGAAAACHTAPGPEPPNSCASLDRRWPASTPI